MSNPLDDYLGATEGAEKTAAPPWGQMATALGKDVATGMISTGLVAGLGVAAMKMKNAIRKRTEFQAMLDSDADLKSKYDMNPRRFNSVYNSFRRVAPKFAAEPVIAASHMQKMLGEDAAGEMAGDFLTQAAISHSQAFRGGPAFSVESKGLGPANIGVSAKY